MTASASSRTSPSSPPKASSAPSAAEKASALHALAEGRRLSRAKDYENAIAAFRRALAIDPEDPRVLAELGYAAYHAHDFANAEKADQKALANAHEPALKAQIFYNQGLVFEAKDDKDKAARAYEQSLALRDNAEVRKHLTAIRPEPAPPEEEVKVPCPAAEPTLDGVCACLVKDAADELLHPDWAEGPGTCGEEKSPTPLGDPRLLLVAWSAGTLGETAHLVALREGAAGPVRLLAELGRDYEPGAFGIHNVLTPKGGEARVFGGHPIVVLRAEQAFNDFNMAGLELCQRVEEREVYCALSGPARCTEAIPMHITASCGPGTEPDPSQLDDDTRAMMKDIKSRAYKSEARLKATIAEGGKLVVTLLPGSAKDLVEKNTLGPHDFL